MSENLQHRDGLIYYEGTEKLAEGHFECFSEEGPLYCEYSLKNGRYDGYIITYWANGKVAHKGFFEEGICNSEIFFYYPTGQIQAVDQMKNNVCHGISQMDIIQLLHKEGKSALAPNISRDLKKLESRKLLETKGKIYFPSE